MSEVSLTELAEIVAVWASETPIVREAYLFGSRVKGTHGSNSDLDVAIVLFGDNEGYAYWLCEAEKLRISLSRQLPVPCDLQMMHAGDVIAMPAVREHGLLVFERLAE